MIKLNKSGYTWARKLIFSGQVNKDSDWSFEGRDKDGLFELSNKDWKSYGRWFLGVDDSTDEDSFNHWVYPIGKAGEVFQNGIKAIKSDSAQHGINDVNENAEVLLKTIEDNKPLYTINDENEVLIYGIIYPDDAKLIIDKVKQVSKNQDEINIRLNTPGGSFAEGLAVFNYLKSFPKKINTIIDGQASSAGSLIACGGHVVMFDSSVMLVHNPWSLAAGDYRDFANYTENLDKLAQSAATAYAHKTGMSLSDVRQLMDKDTYLTAREAYEIGLCDEIVNKSAYMSTRKTNLFGGNIMKIKDVLAGLKLPTDDNTVQMIVNAVEVDNKEEVEKLKTQVAAFGKTSMIAKLTGRIGDGPAKMLGKVHDCLPSENFEEITQMIETLQSTIKDLGGAKGKKVEPTGTTSDDVINMKVKEIAEAEKVPESEALEILANREPELIANWR